MKRAVLIFFPFTVLLIILGCSIVEKHNNPHEGSITYFKYNYGSGMGYVFHHEISDNYDEMVLTANGWDGFDGSKLFEDVKRAVDRKALDDIKNIVNHNALYEWNGFNKSEKGLMDGYGFTLDIRYDDGQTLKASGYGKYPDDYWDKHEILASYLEELRNP